jgi:hypothetical protein
MFHAMRFAQSTPLLTKSEKALANRPMNDKRIGTINTNQSVPKKKKTVEAEIAGGAPPEAGESPAEIKVKKTPAVRQTSARKSAAVGKKSVTAGKRKVSMPAAAATITEPTDDAIRLRAYFISERRRRFALPGNAESDWVEAKRQLLSETGPR